MVAMYAYIGTHTGYTHVGQQRVVSAIRAALPAGCYI